MQRRASAIAEHDNLLLASHRARRGKQDRSAVQCFAANLDAETEALRQELLAEDVRLLGHRFFPVHDPKPRRIAALERGSEASPSARLGRRQGLPSRWH